MDSGSMNTGQFPRAWRGYKRTDVDLAAARSALRIEQLEYDLEGTIKRADAMQVELKELNVQLDELRTREATLSKSLKDLHERREHIDRESALRARQLLLDAEERASKLKSDGLRKVGELQQQVEQLLGMRSGLTQALQRLSEDIAAAMARIAAAPATSIDRPVEEQVARWSSEVHPD